MTNIDGVILAAGRSSRMGESNKVQSQLAGRTLLDHVRDRLEPQVDQLIVNGDSAICGEAAVVDVIDAAKGPLVNCVYLRNGVEKKLCTGQSGLACA